LFCSFFILSIVASLLDSCCKEYLCPSHCPCRCIMMEKSSTPSSLKSASVPISASTKPFLLFVSHVSLSLLAAIVALLVYPRIDNKNPITPWQSLLYAGSNISIESPAADVKPFTCNQQHTYSTEIISLDPLVVYIRNFTYSEEIKDLLRVG
jgi:hypothetical protein